MECIDLKEDFIFNQYKKAFFKTEEMEKKNGKNKITARASEAKIVYDDHLQMQLDYYIDEHNLTNSKIFITIIEIITLSSLILQTSIGCLNIYGNLFKYLSISEFFIYLLQKLVCTLIWIIRKKIFSKNFLIFFNIPFIYLSLIVLIIVLLFQDNEKLNFKDIEFLFYYLILISVFIFNFIPYCICFFIMFTFIVNSTVIISLSIYFEDFIQIPKLIIFAIILTLITAMSKFKGKEILKQSFENTKMIQKLIQNTNSIMGELKVCCFTFKNTDLILTSDRANSLLFKFNKTIPNSFSISKFLFEENTSQILIKQTETLKLRVNSNNNNNNNNNQINSHTNLPILDELQFSCNSALNKTLVKALFKNLISKSHNQEHLISFTKSFEDEKNLHKILKKLNYGSKRGNNESSSCYISSGNFNLGRFELDISGNKANYEILLKTDLTSSPGDCISEFIITDIEEKVRNETKFRQNDNRLLDLQNKEKAFRRQAHEFKTPLNSIIGGCEQLSNKISNLYIDIETGTLVEKVASISQMAKQLANMSLYVQYLIRDLISSHDKLLDLIVSYKKVKLNDIVDFCFGILNSLIHCDEMKSNSVRPILRNEIADEELIINTDDIRLKQILLNFISNSVKFTHQGKIIIKANISKKDTQILKISVKDTGTGIKEEFKDKLFTEYSKLTNDNNEFGTGLGLYISNLIANKMNYSIKMKSKEKNGTKMSLYLPLEFNESTSRGKPQGNKFEVEVGIVQTKRSNVEKCSLFDKDSSFSEDLNKMTKSNFKRRTGKVKSKISVILKNRDEKETDRNSKLNEFKYGDFNYLTAKRRESFASSSRYNFKSRSDNKDKVTSSLPGTINNINNFNININSSHREFSSRAQEKILVIDDQQFPRKIIANNIREILTECSTNDYQILEGSDGVDCLKFIIDYPNLVKCIFIDQNMTFMNGTETAFIIRKMQNLSNSPTLFLISSDDNQIDFEIFDACIPKPIAKSNLKDILVKYKIVRE